MQSPDWRRWRHITKLDPDRPFTPELLEAVFTSGTDAIVVGGTTGMTRSAVSTMLRALQRAPVPVALEVSTLEAATAGQASLYFIPLVLNTNRGEWMGRHQAEALSRILPHFGPFIPWSLMVPEAYLVLNPQSAAARLTEADTALTPAQAAAYAAYAGRILRLPIVYVEYSGTFGDMELLAAVKEGAGGAHVIYGGGIATAEQAAAAGSVADTIVVGNLIYRDPGRLRETVAAVQRR